MNEQQYRAVTDWARRSPSRLRLITALCRLLPVTLFVLYGLSSLYLLFYFFSGHFSARLLAFWIVPGLGFVSVSILRKRINAPRPYECFSFTPLLSHHTGKSFPSRHTACAFLISLSFLWLSGMGIFPSALAWLSLIFALLTGLSRLVAGLHFVRDVLAGIAWAVVFSCFYFLF